MNNIRKYVIRNNRKNCKDMYFGGWGLHILTGEPYPMWYNRDSEDVFKFFSKSEAKHYAKPIIEKGRKVKIVKLKRTEWVYEKGGDN